MGITTKDLAQMCGVSRSTIQRALSGEGRIRPETREKILRVAKENNYQPDLLARGLVRGKTWNIGIVVLDVKNRYFAEMISVFGSEANQHGYCMNIMLHDNNGDLEMEQLKRLAAYHMDGIILSSVHKGGEAYRSFLDEIDVPLVSIDNKIADGIPYVGIDQRRAMADAARQALCKGYHKLVYVSPPLRDKGQQNLYVHQERAKGFEDACREFPESEAVYLYEEDYLDRAEQMISAENRTAFVCSADSFALDLMMRLGKAGKTPPRDYGIIGFDNVDTLEYLPQQLSTVSSSTHQIAVTAIGLLFELMEEKQKQGEISEEHKNTQIILPHELIAGDTI